jgi:predicted O-linked N-acetylglucosamine transferase (SPINDLY family)
MGGFPVLTIPNTLTMALQHHQAGRLPQAESLYRQILQAQPGHPDALHLLGVIAHQRGQHAIAVEHIGQAVVLKPENPTFHNNLGAAYRALNKLAEAEAQYRQAVALQPDYAEACHNLGNVLKEQGKLGEAVAHYQRVLELRPDSAESYNRLGNVLKEQGKPAEAENQYRQAVAIQPDLAEGYFNLGNVLTELRRLDEAETQLRRAVAIQPGYAEAHNNLGTVLQEQGKLVEAEGQYRQAVLLNPGYAEAFYNLGTVLKDQGKLAEAEGQYRQAVVLRPGFAEAYNNLGVALQKEGKLEEAVTHFRQALTLKPRYSEAYNNLGLALQEQGHLADAVQQYRQALAFRPNCAEAYNNLGLALQEQGHLADAVQQYRQALVLRPDYAEAHYNLGNGLSRQGHLLEAVTHYQKALMLSPDYSAAENQLMHLLQFLCEWVGLEELADRQLRRIQASAPGGIPPFTLLSIPSSPADQLVCARNWTENHVASISRLRTSLPFRFEPGPRAKLRIGYLSADFREHPVGILLAELFELHDHATFGVFAYSNGADDGSTTRQRIMRACDRFVDVTGLPFVDAAKQIYADQADILVDLTGHTHGARTGILALRPAPIQVNYLGYPGTMGADFIDYIITDLFLSPPDQAPFFSEQFVYLPDCYQANDRQRKIADQAPTRVECGLPETGVVFCCFNNTFKITPAIFDVWMRLLIAIPGSVLWFRKVHGRATANLRRRAQSRGVDPERLVFAPIVPMDQHLARYRRADLFLDTVPFNAHATCSDALWAGLPVLTCAGDTFASRVAGSLLTAIGLPELITYSLAEYEARAIHLAQHPGELAALRARLSQNRLSGPLFDTPRFTRHLETAYQLMWEIYLRGEPPRQIEVPALPKPVHPESSRRMP